jgi:signal transduction histidine kinase
MPDDQGAQGTVLIVDDQPANLALLSKLLADEGFKVRAVTSGERALDAARRAPPDCVLLDVAMPGMDGFATCEAFRQDAALASIPIIFVTAYDDIEHKLRAFRAGGRDYVSKPLQAEEVCARVRCQLALSRQERELRQRNLALLAANAKLVEIDALKAKVSSMLVHDVRSPLSTISVVLHGQPDDVALGEARVAYQRINRLLTDMLELYRGETATASPLMAGSIDLGVLLGEGIVAANPLATGRQVEVAYEPPAATPVVRGEASKLARVLANLLEHAIAASPAGGKVVVAVGTEAGRGVETGLRYASISVTDSGPGISPQVLPYLFDPMQGGNGQGDEGRGLGLAIVHRLVADHGGRVQAFSQPGSGTELRVLLPI